MTKTIFSKVMWVGRATVFLVGLAVILALVLGVASSAFGANGGNFILGQGNAATALTTLAGKLGVTGPMLRIVNNNEGTNDTALDLRVQGGEAPMRVNSDTRVTSLNADKVDGEDSAAFQKRVSGQCAVGSSIRSINANGVVACEQDDDLNGDAAGGDLSGTYPNPSLANGAVEPANFGAIPTARVHLGLSQTIPSGQFQVVEFPAESYDVGNLHDTDAGNNSRLTAPVSGVYAISATVGFGADPDGFREIHLIKNRDQPTENGLASFKAPPVTSITQDTILTLPTQDKLLAGDSVQVFVKETSGDPLTIKSGPTHFEMTWIAPG